ncbi:MAG: SusD/RagB family nutrient-binding outer membrane lipoprotein [Bacteroidales bacterium]|nr:SusD/RagB family nutrient-binding outer membrane lipoprotein [Bacteroidales bacterium]
MKNIRIKYIVSIALASMLVMLSGCEKWLDINEDPNNPTEVPVSQLLTAVEIDLAGSLGSSVGGLSGYTSATVHHMFQRGNTAQFYDLQGTDFEVITPWNIMYQRLLTGVRQIIDLGTASEGNEDWHYVGISQIMKAYTFSLLVDVWGDVPYTESNQGAELRAPHYDNGQSIYPQLFQMIDEGLSNLEKESFLSPGTDDVIYQGDLDKWKKFAKTLKLKMYNQIRLVEDVSAEVATLLADESELIGPEDDFEFQYGAAVAPMNRNPGYQQEYTPGGSYYYINPYFYEILMGQNSFFPVEGNPYLGIVDPRVPYYFYNQLASGQDAENPVAYRNGDFVSVYMYSYNIDPNEGFDQASSQTIAGLYPLGGRYDDGNGGIASFNGAGDTPQRMLTYFSRLYTQAEMALVGVTNQDPAQLLEDAIQASYDKVNEVASAAGAPPIVQSEIDDYIDEVMLLYDASDNDGKLRHIMTQKWIANYGSAVDSYTDYRRTGYPLLHNGNTDNLDVTVQTRDYPVSYPWKSDDLSVNQNAPNQKNITMFKVFWDAN